MRDHTDWKPICSPPAGLVRPVRLDPDGKTGPTRGQARSSKWRQTSRGYYVPSETDSTIPEQRVLEASVLLPEGGAVTGWGACRWLGAGYFDGMQPDGRTERQISLAIGPHGDLRDRPSIHVMRDRLEPSEVRVIRGTPCTTPERALFDEMRTVKGVREATVAVDMMAIAELTSISRMRAYCTVRSRWNGLPQVVAALDLAAEDSMSPNETRMRLIWVLDAGLPNPLVNQPVFDLQGRLLGIADLLDPVAGVVGEFDGAAHRGAGRHRRDVLREDRFRRAGLEYFKVVGLDLADIGLVVDRMLSTRKRAAFDAPDRRRWTINPPSGGNTSPLENASLDERLAYREWMYGSGNQPPGS